MAVDRIARIEDILRSLRGVRGIGRLDETARNQCARIEAENEAAAAVPVRNIGVRSAASRAEAFVILKDASFRQPGMPTVYLVEEALEPRPAATAEMRLERSDPFGLLVEGRGYRVIGEEIFCSAGAPAGPRRSDALFLADSFVMYPERRTGAHVPCLFILPPIPFPELEHRQEELAISGIVSVSPSLAVDMYLRELFGFDRTNELATILVGFDPVP